MPAPIGRRPVLVVQANHFNESRIRSVIVALITSSLAWESAPGNVRLPAGEAGLPKPCVVNISQLYTIDRARLTDRLGTLEGPLQARVDAGLRLVLDLPGAGKSGVMDVAAEYLVQGGARG